jgi:hypothetical protein
VRARAPSRGLAAAEYVGLVAVVGLVIAGLLVLRRHDAGRTPPVRPLPAILELIGAPARPLVRPPPRPTPRPRRPTRPRPRRPVEPRIVDVPRWLVGP